MRAARGGRAKPGNPPRENGVREASLDPALATMKFALLVTAALAALVPGAPAKATNLGAPCAEMGTADIAWMGTAKVPSCRRFNYGLQKKAVNLPADSATAVYGTFDTRLGTLTDRTGKTWNVRDDAIPGDLDAGQMNQVIVKGTVVKNIPVLQGLEPALWIEKKAMLLPFMGTFFSGVFTNL